MSHNGSQPNFVRCLPVSWAGTLYIHFRGLLSHYGILPDAKFTLRPSLALSYIGSVTARHSSSGRQPNCGVDQRAPPIFDRAAITLGIGPHSSSFFLLSIYLSFFFFFAYSQPLQIGCLPYFDAWRGLSANLGCRSETCCTWLAENRGRKKSSKFAICAPSHNFVGLCLRN